MTAAAPRVTAPPVPLLAEVPEDPDVRVAFTGRLAPPRAAGANLSLVVGAGDVGAARAAALGLVGGTADRAVFMAQVHGGDVATVSSRDGGRGVRRHADAVADVDALVTRSRDLTLAVLVADCVPVVLVAPGSAVGVVHAGRGGVVAGVVEAAVRALTPAPADVVALVGPAIGGCCYEVPQDMADAVAAAVPAARATTTWGSPSLDLPSAVRGQLAAAGVARVEEHGGCTRCHADLWFSHRATTAGLAAPGRQAALVRRATPDEGRPAS